MSANSSVQPGSGTARVSTGLPRRYGAYLRERFPLIGNALLIVSFFSSNQFLAHALHSPGQPMRYDLRSLLGCITLCCFFLHIRIFDDHKDYENDCRYFPERALQRGIVSLTDLKRLLAGLLLLEFASAAWCGAATLVAWTAAMLFSLGMLREFLVGPWLRKRFLLYASLHMLIIPVLTALIWAFATAEPFWQAPAWYWLYSAISYLLAFNWEVSRKIRVPDEEVAGVDTYSARLGTRGAAWLAQLLRFVCTVLVAAIAFHLGLSLRFYGVLLMLFGACSVGLLQHTVQATSRTARWMEIYAGVYILAFDVALAIELGLRYGIVLGGVR